jgi:hypothetical protein
MIGEFLHRISALSAPRAVQAALLGLQVVDIPLPFPIGHSFVTTLCIFRQPIVILVGLAIRHLSVSALFVPAESFEFGVYRGVRAEGARVARVEPAIAIAAGR